MECGRRSVFVVIDADATPWPLAVAQTAATVKEFAKSVTALQSQQGGWDRRELSRFILIYFCVRMNSAI